jgi:hypothetical protein
MNGIEETLDFSTVVTRNIGRPRTALFVGCDPALARGLGEQIRSVKPCVVTTAATPEELPGALAQARQGAQVDAIVLDATSAWDLDRVLGDFRDALTDGGHVFVYTRVGEGPKRGDVMRSMAQAGLEVMRFDAVPGALRPIANNLVSGSDASQFMQTSARLLLRRMTNPVEMLVGKVLPEGFSDAGLVVARVPPKKGSLSLTIGMLTYNEEESVERMIADIRSVAPDAKLLLIDSSNDKTPEIAERLGARVVRQLPPRGHGPAMERLMYETVLESEALIYLDCDFTYPIAEIPNILRLLEDGADVVNASRTRHRPEAMPLPNFIANRVFAAAAQLAHGAPTTDVHSGMRGYRSSVTRAFAFSGERDALPLDTLLLPARSNYHVIEYAIPYYERVGVSKLQKLSGTVWTFGRIAAAYRVGERVRRGKRYEVL